MTTEEKAKRYDEALARANELNYVSDKDSLQCKTIEHIFPELGETEDERIRRVIRGWIYTRPASFFDGISKEKMLAWLEKQDGKINPYSGTSFKYNNHTWGMCARDGGVNILCDGKLIKHIDEQKTDERKEFVLVSFGTDIKSENDAIIIPDGYVATIDGNKIYIKKEGKGALEAIKEEKVDNANKVEPKFKVGDIVQYITDSTDRRKIEEVDTLCNMYHTDSSPIMFEIEDEWKAVVNAEDVEQNPTDKIESKFKVGDWVIRADGDYFSNGSKFAQITDIDKGCHWLDSGKWIEARDIKLWSIADAKDGDVLAVSWREDKNLWQKIIIFKKYHNEGVKELYGMPCVEGYGNTFKNGEVVINEEVPYYSKTWTCTLHPATKEQRELLFSKMEEARNGL